MLQVSCSSLDILMYTYILSVCLFVDHRSSYLAVCRSVAVVDQFVWEQADFDFTVGQCRASYETSVY